MKPIRIQRKRIKGWKMPLNTIYVGRPSKWGNPFKISEYGSYLALDKYKDYISMHVYLRGEVKKKLKGKNLACWCPIDTIHHVDPSCHADILLKIANSE